MKNKFEIRQTLLSSGFCNLSSSLRLNRIQSLVKDEEKGVIFIPLGIDSRYNEGCKETANFLFFNLFTYLTSQVDSSEISDEDTEDVIIAVKENSVAVYCNYVIYDYLLPYMAHWKNLSVYCLHGKDLDQDAMELYKVESFMLMMSGCEQVLIPYKMNVDTAKFDKLLIEKWPIIQAYAVEGFGKGIFFTMEYNVSNIYNEVHSTFEDLDIAKFEKVIIESLSLTQRHWLEMKSVFTSPNNVLGDVSHEKAAEPLASFFKHGELSHEDGYGSNNTNTSTNNIPFVKFGRYTATEAVVDPKATVSQSGTDESSSALHMVIQSIAPQTHLCCTRTYFFPPDVNAPAHVKMDYKRLSFLYSLCADACQLAIQHYCETGSVSGAREKAGLLMKPYLDSVPNPPPAPPTVCIEAMDKSNRWHRAEDGKFFSSLKRATIHIDDIPSSADPGLVLGGVCKSDTFIDSYIQVVGAIDSNVATLESSSGSTVAAGSSRQHNNYVVLTSPISGYVEYVADTAKDNVVDGEDGHWLCKNVYLCSNSSLAEAHSSVSVDFDLESTRPSRIRIFARDCQPIVIDLFQDVQWIELYEPGEDTATDITLLQLVLKEDSDIQHPLLFSSAKSLQPSDSKHTAVAIALQARSKSFDTVKYKVVPALESMLKCASSNGFSFKISSTPMPCLQNTFQDFQDKFEWIMGRDSNMITHAIDNFPWFKPEAKNNAARNMSTVTNALQPSLNKFRSHFSLSCCFGKQPVLDLHLDLLLKSGEKEMIKRDSSPEKIGKVNITIVIGSPGAYVDEICNSLLTVNRECVRWVVLRCQALDEPTQLDYKHLQRMLKETVAKRRAIRPGAAATKRLRIVVACNGYFDLEQVISTISSHDDDVTRSNMSIACTISCVEQNASTIPNGLILPQIANQCAVGLCNCIAFTGARKSNADKQNLKRLQEFLRVVNPDVAHILAEGGQSIRANDFDLLLGDDSFKETAMMRKRLLAFPQLYTGKQLIPNATFGWKSIQRMSIDFYQPLFKGVFETRLRALNNMCFLRMKNSRVFVVKGFLGYLGETNKEYEVTFANDSRALTYNIREKIEEKSDLTPAPPAPRTPAPPRPAPPSRNRQGKSPEAGDGLVRYQLTFYGVGLDRGRLMDWLGKCGRINATKRTCKTRQTLTQRDMMKIQRKHRTDPLPEGYFFNGYQYCSLMDSERTDLHPLFEKFVEEYIEEENAKADQYNSKLLNTGLPDMFQPAA